MRRLALGMRRGLALAAAAALTVGAAAHVTEARAAVDADIGAAARDIDPDVTAARVADLVLAFGEELAAAIIYRATNENPRLTLFAVVEEMLAAGVEPTVAVAASAEAQPEAAGEIVFTVASVLGLRTGGQGDERDMSVAERIASAAIAGIKSRERAGGDLGLTSGDVRIQVASVAAELTPFIGDDQRAAFLTFVVFEANIAGYTLSELTENIITFTAGDGEDDSASDLLDTTTRTPTQIGSSSR